jgi:hypothetical protein
VGRSPHASSPFSGVPSAGGLSSAERDELVKLRRELRVAKLEVEIV